MLRNFGTGFLHERNFKLLLRRNRLRQWLQQNLQKSWYQIYRRLHWEPNKKFYLQKNSHQEIILTKNNWTAKFKNFKFFKCCVTSVYDTKLYPQGPPNACCGETNFGDNYSKTCKSGDVICIFGCADNNIIESIYKKFSQFQTVNNPDHKAMNRAIQEIQKSFECCGTSGYRNDVFPDGPPNSCCGETDFSDNYSKNCKRDDVKYIEGCNEKV